MATRIVGTGGRQREDSESRGTIHVFRNGAGVG